jgi:hypothetical protein
MRRFLQNGFATMCEPLAVEHLGDAVAVLLSIKIADLAKP